MGKLPNHERAIIPDAKLRYCLDPEHPTGRHKARVFRSALGLDIDCVHELEAMLRQGIARKRAVRRDSAPGCPERWVVEWIVRGRHGPLRFISAWDLNPPRRCPRLVSCYLKRMHR